MAYAITRADLASITDPELAFSTTRLLPQWEDIPEEFHRQNVYTELTEAIFLNRPLPDMEIEFLPGFDDEAAPADLNKCVRAHLQSFGSQHQHKIAGVAFMMSVVCKITK